MKAYETALLEHKSALDIPVTEVVIFKLLNDRTDETTVSIERDFVANSIKAEGVKRISWGYSVDDPRTVILMFDWRKIQDHWAFWQTDYFPPVLGCIERLFEPGRPLVRHYEFDPVGMLDQEYVRVLVWDEQGGSLNSSADVMEGVGGNSSIRKGGFAVDLDEMTWFCALLGYESEETASKDPVTFKGETHVVKLKFFQPE